MDLKSAKEITKIKPKFIKIGSATNLNFPILKYISENFLVNSYFIRMTSLKEKK